MGDIQFTRGRTTGLGVHGAWIKIFHENERAGKRRKLCDVRIADWMVREFPRHASKFFLSLRAGNVGLVQRARSRYNRGDMTQGMKPNRTSHRYDRQGNLADPIYSGKLGVSLTR